MSKVAREGRLQRIETTARFEGARARLSRALGPQTLPLVFSVPVLLVVVLLLLFVLYMTFVPVTPTEPGYTLSHWTSLGRAYVFTKVIPNTLIMGAVAVGTALFFGCPLAWLLYRAKLPLRDTFVMLMAVSVIVPGFIKAMGWIMLLNKRSGMLNAALAWIPGVESVPLDVSNVYGAGWIMGLFLAPVMFFLLAGPLQALDPALEEAASVCKASRLATFFRVSLPLIWPGILGGTIYVAMTAISIFEVPALLGGLGSAMPVLSTELFYEVHPQSLTSLDIKYGRAGVYGALMAVPSLAALYFYYRLLAKSRRYEVITGKGYRPKAVDLGRWRYLALAFVVLYMALAVFLPLLVLVWVSLLPVVQLPSTEALSKLTLENYRNFMPQVAGARGSTLLRNTAVLVATVAAMTVFFSFMVSWIVVRSRMRARFAMDTVAMLPHAVPSIAIAFGLFMIALVTIRWAGWIPLGGTLGIIAIAHIVTRLPYATRMTNSALLQVQQELEESAKVCGAGALATMWRVMVPLIRPTLVLCTIWTAMLSLTELTMALFLTSPKNQVLSVGIWNLWQRGLPGVAAAGAVGMVTVAGIIVLLTLAIVGRSTRRSSGVPAEGVVGR